MADNYQMYYGREEGWDQNASRVYINPNFKRIERNFPLPPHSSMHVNPNFHQHLPYLPQRNVANNTNIHVNPNFIRVNNNPTQLSHNFKPDKDNGAMSNSNIKEQGNYNQGLVNNLPPIVSLPTQRSRYQVVRHHKVENKIIVAQPVPIAHKMTTTFKINRYKSVPLVDVKKNLETAKPVLKLPTKLLNQQVQKQTCKKIISSPKEFKNRFKFVKRNIECLVPNKSELKTPVVRKSLTMKNLLRSNLKAKYKTNTKLLKKNNIPCQLFKKYGKCLRNIHGSCEFLHDKKHVSICRKFLKGACHDKECLLSHDLTVQKMPTCSFYLNGMCTKEGCPYLHVKLNEKTKVCTDFLKGFCERGDKCLNRHVNVLPESKTSNVNKMRKIRNSRNSNQSFKSSTQAKRIIKSKTSKETSEQNTKVTDCRYYKEINEASTSSMFETIKPTRCKLGTLPSFIQL